MSEENGVIVIEGPEQIAMFRLLQIKHALRLEIKTGMKLKGGSLLKLVNREYGQSFRTKKDALAFIEAIVDAINEENGIEKEKEEG
jgi:hypothetical protein